MGTKDMLPGSKWIKHQAVYESETLRQHLPHTEIYTQEQLRAYLDQYDVVFVKPAVGGGGHNIFQVKRIAEGNYLVSLKKVKRKLTNLADIHRWIEEIAKGKTFLIQSGIDLAKWQGRPVDLRSVVQLNEDGEWEVTGMLAKMAGENLAVTNVCAGGSVHSLSDYLRALGYEPAQIKAKLKECAEVSLNIADQLHQNYDNAIYGLDIGLDTSGQFWLIEANTVPDLTMFKIYRKRQHARMMKLWKINEPINAIAVQKLRNRTRKAKQLQKQQQQQSQSNDNPLQP